MRIGILQAGHFPEELVATSGTYSELYSKLLEGHGFTYQTWSVVDDEFPDAPTDADGWLISGSKFGAYENYPWIARLEAFVRDIRASDRPLVGICFGHQIIAKALGGKVEKFEGGWSAGRVEYDFEGKTVALNAWHQDQVTERPADAQLIGSSPFCENAALIYGDTILTVQPHPEFDATEVEGLIRIRGDLLSEDVKNHAAAMAGQPVHNVDFGNRIGAFFLASRKG